MRIRRAFSLFLLLLIGASGIMEANSAAARSFVFVGTFADGGTIYSYRFDPVAGRLSAPKVAAKSPRPEWLALHPGGKFLYAVNEIPAYAGQPAGSLSVFAVDSSTGKLSLLDRASSRDEGPAHVTTDRTAKYVLISNYPQGSLVVLPVLKDGRLGNPSAFVRHQGSGLDPERQAGPHVHAVVLSPDNRFALVADLGLDEVIVYPFDESHGTLGKAQITKVKPGSGPRHLVFSSTGKFVYLLNELSSSVTVFSYEAAAGALAELQTISSLSTDFAGRSFAAEIAIHPSGKFLYASNRGEDSIAVFAIDQAAGTLEAVENTPTKGKTPRNFAIDPSGSWLLVGNQESDSIVTFRIDGKTGHLTPAGKVVQVGSPVCIQFDPR